MVALEEWGRSTGWSGLDEIVSQHDQLAKCDRNANADNQTYDNPAKKEQARQTQDANKKQFSDEQNRFLEVCQVTTCAEILPLA